MKTGSLLTAALGLISATAALAQQCTYFEGRKIRQGKSVSLNCALFCNGQLGLSRDAVPEKSHSSG